jgi:hypothetical protein
LTPSGRRCARRLSFRSPSPLFCRNGDKPRLPLTDVALRGGAITIISPVNYVRTSPAAAFEWQSYGEGIEYKFSIGNHKPMWETPTMETSITLPEEIQAKLVPGETYTWQVKGFKKDGTLVAISSKVRFRSTRSCPSLRS